MCISIRPFAHAESIFEIEPDFYKKLGIKVLFTDLDNTLDRFDTLLPSQRVINYINTLKENNIDIYIISNNDGHRITDYANALNVKFMKLSGKPFSTRINKFINDNGINKDELIFIGDQLLTDYLACKGAKIRCIVTEPLFKKDQWTTFLNRKVDKIIRKRLAKKHKLTDWRDIYVNNN